MIREDTRPVLVCYEPKRALFEEVYAEAQTGHMTRRLWQRAQPLLVGLYSRDINKQEQAGLIEDAIPESPGALYVWKGKYDMSRGMVGVARDPADLIVSP